MRYFRLLASLIVLALLTACGSDAALSDVALSEPVINLNTGPRTTMLSYRINQASTVAIWLEQNDQRYVLRDNVAREPSKDPYQLSFDGSANIDPDTRRILPNGDYTVVVQAKPNDGSPIEQRLPLRIDEAPTDQFGVDSLQVSPNPFSPDDDAVEDFTEFSYRLPYTATVSIDILAPDGAQYPFLNRVERGAGEHSERWTGRPVVGGVLAPGEYQYRLMADDLRGNVITKRGAITISSAGVGELRVLEVNIGPDRLQLGDVLTVTYRIKNTGPVKLRTYGPPSGYEYNTNQSYSSIEGEQYANLGGGLWRVGLDWDANGGAGSRYPFRWAISPRPPDQWYDPNKFDYLYPGEEAIITGRVQIKQRENRMTFYTGVAHEGVDYPSDRLKPTVILVSF